MNPDPSNGAQNEQSAAAVVQSTEAGSEIQEYLAVSQQRRRLFPRAALVGLGAGLTAALFRLSLNQADALRNALLEWAHRYPAWGWLFPILFSALGATVSVLLVRRYAPETSGSGIPHLKAVLHRFRTLSWKRVLPVKFVAGVLAIGSGLALGREGPTVQMGGAVGEAVSTLLKVAPRERRTLIASGAGAGLAAAFFAPLSGLMFVLEEVQRDFHPIVFGAAFIAAVTSAIVARLLSNGLPVFPIPAYPTPPVASLPGFALLGILAGFLGVAYNRSLLSALSISAWLQKRWGYAIPAIVGGLIGLVGWFYPGLIGSGNALAETALLGKLALTAVPLIFLLRFFMTAASYGTGASGGIFAPLLVLGSVLGLGLGQIVHAIAPTVLPEPAVFAVVGMAAYFTAIVRAPLTGIMLILEMTGNYHQMLPLLISCFCAYAVAELLKDLPIYEALLERDLLRDGLHISLEEPMIIDFEIEDQAPFVGQTVRSLGLPPGCVLVRCTLAGRELIPTAFTRLEAHMHITAIIAPEAANGFYMLRQGCKAERG